MQFISADRIHALLEWEGVLAAMQDAHQGHRPVGDSFFIGDASYGMLSRGVILPGSGAGLKLASICPANADANPPRPVEDAAFVVLDEHTKAISAILDGPAITRWKTAADSALAATRLSREDSSVLLVLGAGPIARALVDAYLHIRPSIREVLLWNRTASRLAGTCRDLQAKGIDATVIEDLPAGMLKADIIASATSSSTPLIRADSVRPGTHVDLIGGYRPDMQEAESALLGVARIFVDDRTTAAVSGDIQIPMQDGMITENQIEGDLYDLCQKNYSDRGADDVTVYKNAGGAHLDLIVSQYVLRQVKASC